MKKNSMAKIMAFLALFGIIIGIVGTGALIIFSGNSNNNNNITNNKNISQKDLQKLINSSKIITNTLSGKVSNSTGTKITK